MQERSVKEWTRLFYSCFSFPTMQKGWRLYTMGQVIDYDLNPDERLLEAHVAKPGANWNFYERPSLSLGDFRDSECTCLKRNCEHLAALAFTYLEEELDIDSQLILKPGGSAWGQSESVSSGAQSVWDSPKAGIAASSVKAAKVQAPAASSSVEEWHSYFRHRFPPERLSTLRGGDTFYNTVYGGLAPISSAWHPTLRGLYELHVLLFTFKLLDELSGSGYRYSLGYDYYAIRQLFSDLFNQTYDQLLRLLRTLHGEEARSLYSEHLQATADYLARHAFPLSAGFVSWMPIYISIWSGLLMEEARTDREKARLSRAARQEEVSPALFDQLLTARILFDVEEGQDEAAWAKASQLKSRGHIRLYPFLFGFQHTGQWARLQLWLEKLAPMIREKWGQPDETYYELWSHLLDKHAAREAWERVMLQLLPASLPYYLDQLMRQERFQEWVDLHMAFGYTPLDLRVSDYKPIELKRKSLLLPWFHHSIEKLIAEKNRDSYKRAVRLMKKLRTMYGKLKQKERWELYLNHIREKYSRLRALQQELGQLTKGEA
ncbi:hypothetical protein [Paenibacillus puerhi]|uniref:hypothetical protein n=1 Tax=Paenibacillus puerhi TaxID=2692622 RepID=UPI00135BC942|nr:hypothetical protein [Paenibacillus puerhi]